MVLIICCQMNAQADLNQRYMQIGQYLFCSVHFVWYIIQLMHSFEVDIRICQPENSDVHQGEAEVNITFEG